MLRTGYSSDSVIKELSRRHFADSIDTDAEKQLLKAGATPELIAALKSGTYAVSAEEMERAEQEMEAQSNRRALEAEKSRKFNTLYQSQLAQQQRAAAQPLSASGEGFYNQLKGDLVYWHNGSVTRFDDTPLEKKKLFLLYFSAHWCAPCRQFTPNLVAYYNNVAAQHPEFELIFVSSDKSPFAMETYMREMNMPWPAIDFQRVAGKEGVKKYAGSGIPDLVLLDANGRIISDSFEGKKYLGPDKVIGDLNAIFAGKSVAYAGPPNR